MAQTKPCPKCGAELPADAPAGICPKCLMQAGLASDQDAGSNPQMKPTTLTSAFVPPEPEALAKHFPQLEILELLGKGGMGAVYKARQPALDRLVAVKILPPEVGADPAFAERFIREARALAKLSHQNIVSIFDFGQADGLYYFIMEFVDGANLRHLIETEAIKPEEALAIVPQICAALQFAHDEGIVHRDIKPENILLDKQGRVKIADFGLAKLLGDVADDIALTGTHQAMGTLHYMAPEQMQGAGSVDHRADIYSLGVVFYEMLTGQLPIGKFEPPSKKVQVDVRLDEIVLRALENEPEQRYQNVSEVKAAVEMMASRPQEAAGSSVVEPAGRTDFEPIYRQVKSPATCLVMIGILHGIATGATGLFALSAMPPQAPPDAVLTFFVFQVLMFFVFSGLLIFGALKMRKLEGYGIAITSSILAIIAGPATLVGLLVGIWALVVLSRTEVRAAFRGKRKHGKRAAPRATGSKVSIPIGAPQSPAVQSPATAGHHPEIPTIVQQVKDPATGLLITGILNWIGIPVVAGILTLTALHQDLPVAYPEQMVLAIALFMFVASGLMIFGALKMRKLEAYGAAITSSILAMIVSPGSVVGFPIGIWALVVLTRREVKAAFQSQKRGGEPVVHETPKSKKTTTNWGILICVLGIAAVCLRWSLISVWNSTELTRRYAWAMGIGWWQGAIVGIAFFVGFCLLLATAGVRPIPKWRPAGLMIVALTAILAAAAFLVAFNAGELPLRPLLNAARVNVQGARLPAHIHVHPELREGPFVALGLGILLLLLAAVELRGVLVHRRSQNETVP